MLYSALPALHLVGAVECWRVARACGRDDLREDSLEGSERHSDGLSACAPASSGNAACDLIKIVVMGNRYL